MEKVHWKSISHAHGTAADVPALLRALISKDQDHREFAMQLLCETIWHQGMVYDATPFVVPILYNLLAADGNAFKELVACLLAIVASGEPFELIKDPIEERLALLYPYLSHTDRTFRCYVAEALGRFPHVLEVLPVLESALESETDEYVRESLQKAIAAN